MKFVTFLFFSTFSDFLSMLTFRTLTALTPLLRPFPTMSETKKKQKHSAHVPETIKLMREYGIVPDLCQVAPAELINVTFPSGAKVQGGNNLTIKQTKEKPKVSFKANGKNYYFLCMTDPDSSSRARITHREWHIWLVGNIPGSDVSQGEILTDYLPPCPPRLTGVHRIVFLVFEQPGKLSFTEPRLCKSTFAGRELLRTEHLVEKYELGQPIAANFFFSQWDEHVDDVYEDLARYHT